MPVSMEMGFCVQRARNAIFTPQPRILVSQERLRMSYIVAAMLDTLEMELFVSHAQNVISML
jgi:hypothetical protein